MQELSLFAFDHIFTYDASRLFVSILLSGRDLSSSILEDAKLRSSIKKIHLFAKSGSPLLTHILKDSLKGAWFSHTAIGQAAMNTLKEIAAGQRLEK